MELLFKINRDNTESIYYQIRSNIINGIVEGNLPAGNRLPSTRQLATTLKVSRNTVSRVYENLTIKGMNTYLNNVIVLENLILNGMGTTGKALLAIGVSVQSKSIDTEKLEVVQGNQVLIMKALIAQEIMGCD